MYHHWFADRENEINESIALVEKEHQATLQVLESLITIDRRSTHLWAGYKSLFAYCTIKLGYSEAAAVRRIKAVRLMRKFPRVKELFAERRLNLTTISLIADEIKIGKLTFAATDELIEKAAGKSREEVQDLMAMRNPVEAFKRRYELRDHISSVFLKVADTGIKEKDLEKRLKLSFSALPDFRQKLIRMEQLLKTKHGPGASLETIFTEAMDFYIKRHCPVEKARRIQERRKKKTNKIEQKIKGPFSRYIPSELWADVVIRDGYRCTYV